MSKRVDLIYQIHSKRDHRNVDHQAMVLLKRLFRLFLYFMAFYLVSAGLLAAAGLYEHPQPADAIVVFGNKVERSGEPSPSLASRLDKAVLLYHQGYAPIVIVSGGTGREGWDEAIVMTEYLEKRGIPTNAILIDSQGNNTFLTAQNTAQIAQQRGLNSFILVSHFYHLPRACLAFARVGLSNVSTAHSERFVARDFYYGLLREVIAFPAYLAGSYAW